jgi:hypothetical protein
MKQGRVLLFVALCASLLTRAGSGAPLLRVRVSPDLAEGLTAALAARGLEATLETGNPGVTEGADLVVGRKSQLTRALEGGRADEDTAVELGVAGGESGPARLVAVAVFDSPHRREAQQLLSALGDVGSRRVFAGRAGVMTSESFRAQSSAFVAGAARYATAVEDWWLPACSAEHNAFNNPQEVLGAPNAIRLGQKDDYAGMMSLGQGGWVVVNMGQTIANGPGNDVRVYQTTSQEPLTLYGGDAPNGPFRLIAFRRECGNQVPGGANSSKYCDFDLGEGGLTSARYLKLEDGELYPCVRGTTVSEGVDIDAVELLN